jgi:hypothetical protein
MFTTKFNTFKMFGGDKGYDLNQVNVQYLVDISRMGSPIFSEDLDCSQNAL